MGVNIVEAILSGLRATSGIDIFGSIKLLQANAKKVYMQKFAYLALPVCFFVTSDPGHVRKSLHAMPSMPCTNTNPCCARCY